MFLLYKEYRVIFVLQNERKMKVFTLNDETKKNSHGFYLVNAGGRLDRFRENPVMLNNHEASQLIGRWQNLRVEGRLLLADAEFDEGDEQAVKVKGKVERGYLKGASVGIIILGAEWRKDPQGEKEIYVTDWELFEASTVSVPSNAGALALQVYDRNCNPLQGDKILSHVEGIIRLSAYKKEKINTLKMNDELKLTAEALVALSVKEGADAEGVSAAIIALKAKADRAEKELEKLREAAESEKQKQAADLVDLCIREGRITSDKRESFLRFALSDYRAAKEALEAIPAKESLSAKVRGVVSGAPLAAGREGWTLLRWMKEDMEGLNRLKAEEPKVYEQIKKKQ